MNNTTIFNSTVKPPPGRPVLSKEQWYERFRSSTQSILDVSLIPIGITGIILNILALIVLKSNRFNLPFYTYLRAYTIAGVFICIVYCTQFTVGAYTVFEFTNSQGSIRFYSYFFQPFLILTNIYGSALDVILSLERVVLLSKKFQWFRRINPRLLCLIILLISFMLANPFWFLLGPHIFSTKLAGGIPFSINYIRPSRFLDKIQSYVTILPYFIDIVPIVFEVTFNVLSIYLIKDYAKKKARIMNNGTSRGDGLTRTNVISRVAPTVDRHRSTSQTQINNNDPSLRMRRMEIKLTILVVFLSLISTM
jgi:hypothetical protein